MDQDRWPRLEELFHAALAREPAARWEFLEIACGADIELRRQLELLLSKEQKAGSFLEWPVLEHEKGTLASAESLVGRQFGAYQVISQLGAGGMGEVYRAHDLRLGRDVAIKTLSREPGRDPERRARLRREARILASL